MKEERILNVLGQVDETYIIEAAAPEKDFRKNRWIKWAVLAACLALVAGACIPLVSHLLQKQEKNEEKNELVLLLEQHGFRAEAIKEPVNVGVADVPYRTREYAVEQLKKKETILDCTIEKIDRLKVRGQGSGDTWYVTTMKLSLNSVIRGKADQDHFTVVSIAATNMAVDYFCIPGLEGAEENMRAAFVLERVGKSELWTVGSSKIPAQELGDYRASACMGFDGETLSIDGRYEISLSELLD